jgi:hypothetical protein
LTVFLCCVFPQEPADLEGLQAFAPAMVACENLAHIDMLYNRIGEEGAEIIRPSVEGNDKIKTFLVDATLPEPLFNALHKKDSGKKGKKGKKK